MTLTNEELLETIRREVVKELRENRESSDRWRAITQTEIERHRKTLYGNGEIGMDENIRTILSYMKQREGDEKALLRQRQDTYNHYVRIAYGTVITTVIILIINGIVYFFRILPIIEKLNP